ncbi:PfkB family carbohydrate kinase [Rhodococcus sp. Q]|uniref:carbohydrate kinase family protein n=1 Tax=Rhodococcus sp. Q TaxID=2502252 RepID=UPI0010F6C1AD|nr:PfkB family carbohydrate kinase [Rhodococcus sp. Q]
MTTDSNQVRALVVGVHVLDTLVRPVTEIPEGQGGALVEQITMTAAGTAAATGLVLSKLGASVRSAGVIGDDALGTLLTSLLERDGVDTSLLHRTSDVQTSASVLPIRPDGSRPAFHVVGANMFLAQHVPWDALDDAEIVHLGAPEFYGGEVAAQLLSRARANGAVTSADSLAAGLPEALAYFEAALPHIDFLMPNDEQVLGWTATTDLHDGCRRLVERGARCVVATAGAKPTVIATADGITEVPTYDVDVVDTTGCGDSFSAGFLRGISLGFGPVDAARLGNATAAQVAQGLGSDHGAFDLATVQAFVRERGGDPA